MNPSEARWRRCSNCKRDIGFNTVHWVCSVSTCNRVRTELQFCSVSCWDAHVPIFRHRDAWAVEARSPKAGAPASPAPARAPATPAGQTSSPRPSAVPAAPARTASAAAAEPRRIMAKSDEPEAGDQDVLIVVSKLKRYVRERSGFNTSDGCMEVLSDHVRAICDRAIESARSSERKTILARDIPKPSR